MTHMSTFLKAWDIHSLFGKVVLSWGQLQILAFILDWDQLENGNLTIKVLFLLQPHMY